MLTAAENKDISIRIMDILPDEPRDALVALALNYACAACAMGLTDERAMEAVKRALAQMRAHGGDGFDPLH